MPDNVRKAIDIAMRKRKHSEFFYQLEDLNAKIRIYKSVFYDKVTKFEQHYKLRKHAAKKERKDFKE